MVWQTLKRFAGNWIARPAALLLGLGLAAIAPNFAPAASLEYRTAAQGEAMNPPLDPQLVAQQQSNVNNIFVYGTSPIAQQLGQDYMVLQIEPDDQVRGLFYQVHSEYACFSGTIRDGKLDLAVVDPYEQVAYAYTLDYEAKGYIANGGDRPVLQLIPAGFQPINVPSELDYALLQECAAQPTPR